MSYEIKLHGRIGTALQELARQEITRTLEEHQALATDAIAEAAHEIRKRVKKLRALLVLLREPLGKERFHEEDAVLRKAAQSLGAKRDKEVLRKTLKHLQRRFFPGHPSPVMQSVQTSLARQESRCLAHLTRSNAIAAHTTSLRELLTRVNDWPVADFRWKDLRRAIHRSYERTRDSYQKAQEAPTATRLHHWRKRVKDLWFHLRLLRRADPPFVDELIQDHEVLGEFLGDDHDLLVLKETLEKGRAARRHKAAMETLFELIDLRREELLNAAFDLGEHLHEESPADFIQELDERRDIHRERSRKGKKLGAKLTAASS